MTRGTPVAAVGWGTWALLRVMPLRRDCPGLGSQHQTPRQVVDLGPGVGRSGGGGATHLGEDSGALTELDQVAVRVAQVAPDFDAMILGLGQELPTP